MCIRCRLDLRVTPIRDLEAMRDEPTTCDVLRRAIDRELVWRRAGMDPDEPIDEWL